MDFQRYAYILGNIKANLVVRGKKTDRVMQMIENKKELLHNRLFIYLQQLFIILLINLYSFV